jgi:hypothetical protein
MATLLEIQILLQDAEPRRALERIVARQQCATAVAACTEAQVQGLARPKAWHGPSEQIGNMVCIPQKRKQSGALYLNCWRTVVICSGGSDRHELDGCHVPGHYPTRGAWGSLLGFLDSPHLYRHCVDSRNRPFVLIHGGHFAMFMHRDEFLQQLVERVRPLAS